MRHVVIEGMGCTTSVAPITLCVARDELLLRERLQGAVFDLVDTFHGTGGGESPAGSALTLVLDGGDSTSGLPVDARVGNDLVLGLCVV